MAKTNVDPAIYYKYIVGTAYLADRIVRLLPKGERATLGALLRSLPGFFLLYSFHYSGKLNDFDKVVNLGNVAAGILAPTMFLHFCLVFPDPATMASAAVARVALFSRFLC